MRDIKDFADNTESNPEGARRRQEALAREEEKNGAPAKRAAEKCARAISDALDELGKARSSLGLEPSASVAPMRKLVSELRRGGGK